MSEVSASMSAGSPQLSAAAAVAAVAPTADRTPPRPIPVLIPRGNGGGVGGGRQVAAAPSSQNFIAKAAQRWQGLGPESQKRIKNWTIGILVAAVAITLISVYGIAPNVDKMKINSDHAAQWWDANSKGFLLGVPIVLMVGIFAISIYHRKYFMTEGNCEKALIPLAVLIILGAGLALADLGQLSDRLNHTFANQQAGVLTSTIPLATIVLIVWAVKERNRQEQLAKVDGGIAVGAAAASATAGLPTPRQPAPAANIDQK